mmetsp:Transcript_6643/g.12145  ORF Transcript_6643/g.12145 Transcript_6643/m.12145 type:complete len:241 (-) Transcript_6643:394-1116(-)
MLGVDLVSGRQLQNGVKDDRVGKSPPRRGPEAGISKEEFEALANLVFTAESIEQANCAERTDRQQMMSIVGDIINTHQSSQGLEPLNNVKQFLSQKKNHERWEETCVELGFAKLPVDEEEEACHGHIMFPEEQFARLLQFDEMKLSMNGCDQEISGRPSCSHTNPELPEAGKSAQKSSKRMTVMAGINFAREALPLYFLIPTDAKEPQVKREFLLALPQVEGQYGFEGRRVVNCGWKMNP